MRDRHFLNKRMTSLIDSQAPIDRFYKLYSHPKEMAQQTQQNKFCQADFSITFVRILFRSV